MGDASVSDSIKTEKSFQVNSEEFRATLGQFPTGITVVSTNDENGNPYGMTANSFGSVSLDPPLVQWSIATKSYSHPIFSAGQGFAINILSAEQKNISQIFTQPIDRFKQVSWEKGLIDLPLIHGCLAWIECDLEDEILCGDHTIFVGRVLRARCFDKRPLLYWQGEYASLSGSGDEEY